jgi:hypothetical protein
MKKIAFILVVATFLAFPFAGTLLAAMPERPLVFVHGYSGSAAQYEAQAMRFAGNGYPTDWIYTVEWNSTFTWVPFPSWDLPSALAAVDAAVAKAIADTGVEQVDLAAHSMGTSVCQVWLSSPERAANVAHYVNYDGGTALAPPGGVETLAIWGEGDPARQIIGAVNMQWADQDHTEVVTAKESFAAVYEFLNGVAPETTDVVPEPPGQVSIAGRAVIWVTNTGVEEDSTLEIYEIHPSTGFRKGNARFSLVLPEDGSFGPFRVNGKKSYEFALIREGYRTHHFYFEPFARTDHLLRLITTAAADGLTIDTSDDSAYLVLSRSKEWWADGTPDPDTIEINGVNIINPAIQPRTKGAVAILAYDANSDHVTDLSAPASDQLFVTAVDIYMPAAIPPDGTITVVSDPRNSDTVINEINIPNWASSEHRVTLIFNDWLQEVDAWPKGKKKKGKK